MSRNVWDFPGGPGVKILNFHCRGVWVVGSILVKELRSHILHGAAKKCLKEE